jgi:hypothetical protein
MSLTSTESSELKKLASIFTKFEKLAASMGADVDELVDFYTLGDIEVKEFKGMRSPHAVNRRNSMLGAKTPYEYLDLSEENIKSRL